MIQLYPPHHLSSHFAGDGGGEEKRGAGGGLYPYIFTIPGSLISKRKQKILNLSQYKLSLQN